MGGLFVDWLLVGGGLFVGGLFVGGLFVGGLIVGVLIVCWSFVGDLFCG